MAPEEGLEPSTHRLTADCSTIELLWNARRRRKLAVGISLRQRAFVADFAAWMAGEAEMAKGQAAGSGVECACGGLRGTAAGWVLGTGYPLKLGTGCGERMRQAVGSGLRGAVPALAGRLGEGLGFRASREGRVCSPSMLAPARSRCRWVRRYDGFIGYGLERGSLWFRLWP